MILLDQAFAHCPKFPTAGLTKRLGPYLNTNVAVQSFNSAKDRSLGELLPHQQTNLKQAHPLAIVNLLIITKLLYVCSRGVIDRAGRLVLSIWIFDSKLRGSFSFCTHSFAILQIRLACIKHITNVCSEPGSNSKSLFTFQR